MSLEESRVALLGVRRLVVKLGTSLSFHPRRGIDPRHLRRLATEIAALRRSGKEVVIVSSGAIGAGMNRLRLLKRPRSIRDKQATAAVGQVVLMDLLASIFWRQGLRLGQVLLTRQDLESGPRYFNARNTLETLLSMGVVPVINENDTVAVDEIKFGDNDRLAALATNLVRADLLVILTDVNGLHTSDPRRRRRARRIPMVRAITPRLRAAAGDQGSLAGTGGMVTKLMAARMCMRHGEHCVVASGRKKGVLARVLAGRDEGTLFLAKPLPPQKRLRWMPYTDKRLSSLRVKEPAIALLRRGQSHLRAAHLRSVAGRFASGEVVRLVDGRGRTFAKGLTRCSSRQCGRMPGSLQIVMWLDDIAFKGTL